ncbi:MAG: hypothetical protein E7137_01495 [Rikenellaceae bacterium]|nr:hypothetical protein [Rikenellaceae bacterium]
MLSYIVKIRRDEPVKFQLESHPDMMALNPKEMMLYSAVMCAAYTLEYQLKRARVQVNSFEIELTGNLSTDTLQAEAYYTDFRIKYRVEGQSSEQESAISQALLKTQDDGCGLIRMLKMIGRVDPEYVIL